MDSGGPCDGYNGDICDSGVRGAAGKSHTSYTLSSRCPVTITSTFYQRFKPE